MQQKLKHGTLPRRSGSPSMVPGPAAAASPRKLSEMQVLKPHFRPIGSETRGSGGGGAEPRKLCLNQSSQVTVMHAEV